MKKYSLIAIVLVAVVALTACTGSNNIMQPSMTSSGTGTVYLNPDVAYVYIGVQTKAEKVATALTENNELAANISAKLQELGVEAKDIQTSAFNVYPNTIYTPEGKSEQDGFTVDNTIYVTVRDLPKLGALLDACVREGANAINGVTYDVQDKEAAFKDARNQAIEKAKANAVDLADTVGVKLGKITMVNVYTSGGVTPLYDAKGFGGMAMSSQVPVSSGQLILTVNADITYEIKN